MFQVLIAVFGLSVFQGISEINCESILRSLRSVGYAFIVLWNLPSPIFCCLLACYFQTASKVPYSLAIVWGIWWSSMWVHPFSMSASLAVAFRPGFHKQNDVERWDRINCVYVSNSQFGFLSIYRTKMVIFLEACIWLIPLVYKHDLMEVSFSAACQGDQISQVDFSRNIPEYFYSLFYLNTGLTGTVVCVMLEGVTFLIRLKRLI